MERLERPPIPSLGGDVGVIRGEDGVRRRLSRGAKRSRQNQGESEFQHHEQTGFEFGPPLRLTVPAGSWSRGDVVAGGNP